MLLTHTHTENKMFVVAGIEDMGGIKATRENCDTMRYELSNCDDERCNAACRSIYPFLYKCGKCGGDKLSCYCSCTCW